MGVVFEAYDRERRELVALKTMRSVGVRELARFKREFRAVHDLAHPNVVALGELFDGESEPFFTMELVRGGTFLDYVRAWDDRAERSDSLTPSTRQQWSSPRDHVSAGNSSSGSSAAAAVPRVAVPVAYDDARLRHALEQLTRAIVAVHGAGLVHRDIKPSNVLVTREGRVVLLDFGLVTETSSPTGPTQSSQTGAVGTVAYMAPEQAISGDIGPAADWFSVGVMLFESLTGVLPHTGRTTFDVILNKQQVPAPPPRQLVPTVPADLDALCVGLLHTDPGQRPSGSDLLTRLGVRTSDTGAFETLAAGPSITAGNPFVGRADELQALRAAFERSHESPVALFVEGVSGVGKTQLVEAFLEQLSDSIPAPVLLSGRCYEREVVSYKAFDGIAEALARYLVRLSPVDVAGLMPMHAALLARLFPSLRRVEAIATAPRLDEAPNPHDQRRRMFGALRELFSRIAERRPLVCFIDDLQWTDADSLILLQDLLGGEDPPPLLLIATMRPVDDDVRRALLRSVDDLAHTEHVPLRELSPAEAENLAALLLPDRDQTVHRAIAADASGHPLLLHALARHLAGSADATVTGASLEEMLAARIDTLPDSTRQLLEVVALYGGPVTQQVAGRAAKMPRADVAKAVHVLRAAHLLRTDGVRHTDRVFTYHDRVREHVTGTLDDERRRYLHRRLAAALAQTDEADLDPRALVRHARAAGQLDQAALHAIAAAQHAMTTLAFDQAAELFAAAVELAEDDQGTLRVLRLQQAAALVHAGRGPEAAGVLMLAADDADPAVRLDCQRQAAEQWINTGHLDKGMDVLRASLAEIGEPLAAGPRRALARVLWNRTRIRLRGLHHRPRMESQVSPEALRRLDVLRTVAHGLAMVNFIRGADFNGRFLLQALRTGEPQRLIEALATEVVYLSSQGGRADRRARRIFARMKELAENAPDDAYARSWLLLADGAAKFFEGTFAEADVALEQCEKVLTSRTTGTTAERNNARVFRLLATRHLGQWRHCRALAVEAIRSGQQRGDRYLEATARLLRVPGLLASDDVATAQPGEDAILWSPPESGYHIQHYYQYNANVEIALYEGTAAERFDELTRAFQALRASMLFRVQMVRVTALGLHGRLCLAAAMAPNSPDEALAQARRMARQLSGEKLGCAQVLGHLLRAGLAPRNSGRTADQLRRAIDGADRDHLALHAAAARDRLGILVGGVEGHELRALAARYVAEERIAVPELMFETVVPGVLAQSH